MSNCIKLKSSVLELPCYLFDIGGFLDFVSEVNSRHPPTNTFLYRPKSDPPPTAEESTFFWYLHSFTVEGPALHINLEEGRSGLTHRALRAIAQTLQRFFLLPSTTRLEFTDSFDGYWEHHSLTIDWFNGTISYES